jgi:hypothetical protein
MSELDRKFRGADVLGVRDCTGECNLARIGIEPKTTVRNAAAPFHIGHLDHDQAGAGIRQHAEVSHVPVVGAAVIGAVLAHRGNNDAVRKVKSADTKRRKQCTAHDRKNMSMMEGTGLQS